MVPLFVGRGEELALLEAVCSGVKREGKPAATLVTGLPGSGKTSLLAALRRRQGASHQLSMAGFETGTQLPLAAAGDLLRGLAKVPGAGASLDAALVGATATDDRPLEPLRIFEAAHRAVLRLEGAVLIFVDDLQWLDELSAALLSYLIRAADAEEKGLALIAASRPAGAGTAVYESMAKDLGPDRTTTIRLGPLGRDDAVRLVRQLAPGVSSERATEIWTLAQGSPFWLGILAQGGEERHLADYLIERERALSREAKRLLSMLAVAARPLSPPELDTLLGWSEARTEHAIAELERAGLAIVDGISVHLAHELIRTSAEAQLPRATLRQLHALFGGWLEQQATGDLLLLLEALVHRREAGLEVGELAVSILQSPRRRLIGRNGLESLAQVANAAGFSDPVAVVLHDRVALLASELGEHRVAMERWIRLASSVSDPAQSARYYLGASRAASRILEYRDQALPLLASAQGQATADRVVEVEIEAQHANVLRVLEHRMDEARRVAGQAVAQARALWAGRDPGTIGSREREAYTAALQAAFDAAVIEDDAADLVRLSDEMTIAAGGSEEATLSAALNTALAFWFVGRTQEAVDHARRAWLQSHERVLPMLSLAAGSALASKLIETGGLGEAEEVISECVEMERRIGGDRARLAIGKVAVRSIHELRHLLWFSRGDWRDAATSLGQELALQPDPHYRIHLHGLIVVWLARCGADTPSADLDSRLLAARADALAAGCRKCAREMALRAAEAYARAGRIDDADKELRAWDADGRRTEAGDHLWRGHVGALVRLAQGDFATGLRDLESVISERSRLGLVMAVLWARIDLAAALVATDAARAATEFRQAGIEAAAFGATTEERLAELGLRRLGVRTWRRGRVSGGQDALARLSERERQIANFIAAGKTNPEIANALFLSRKTIERHVSNVLARSGARNRTELARLVSSALPRADGAVDRLLPRA